MGELLRIIIAATVLASLASIAAPQPTAAEISGDCEAFINGESIGDHDSGDVGSAIEVATDSPVFVEMYHGHVVDGHEVRLEVLGLNWPVLSQRDTTDSYQDELTFDDFSDVSVGLYKLIWEGSGPEGSCQATALIRVPGSPFTTAAGIAATLGAVFGFAGLVLSLRLSINEGQKWALKLKSTGAVERDEDEGRWRIKPSWSLTGAFSGVLTAAGIVTLLQQAALQPPTLEFTLELVLPLTLIGVLILPLLGFNLSALWVLRRPRS